MTMMLLTIFAAGLVAGWLTMGAGILIRQDAARKRRMRRPLCGASLTIAGKAAGPIVAGEMVFRAPDGRVVGAGGERD